MRYKDEEVLIKYRINKKTIIFWCSGIIENNSVATVFNKFLYDFSKGKNVFFYSYRLPEEELPKMIDTNAILDKAETICNPFHVFLKLSDAKINWIFLVYFEKGNRRLLHCYT